MMRTRLSAQLLIFVFCLSFDTVLRGVVDVTVTERY